MLMSLAARLFLPIRTVNSSEPKLVKMTLPRDSASGDDRQHMALSLRVMVMAISSYDTVYLVVIFGDCVFVSREVPRFPFGGRWPHALDPVADKVPNCGATAGKSETDRR